MRRQMGLRIFGAGLLPVVGFLLGAQQTWWLQGGLVLLGLGLAVWLLKQGQEVATSAQAVYGGTIGNWFLILAAYYLAVEGQVWGAAPEGALLMLAVLALLHGGLIVAHVWLNPVQGRGLVLGLSGGYVLLMGLIAWGLWRLDGAPIIAICLMMGSMLYFLISLAYLTKAQASAE